MAKVQALRPRLKGVEDEEVWKQEVARYFDQKDYEAIESKTNRVTAIAMHQGNGIKELNAQEVLDIYSYIQIDDTITRLTELQGMLEKLKDTPLPRPYDYYTRDFLAVFILFFSLWNDRYVLEAQPSSVDCTRNHGGGMDLLPDLRLWHRDVTAVQF